MVAPVRLSLKWLVNLATRTSYHIKDRFNRVGQMEIRWYWAEEWKGKRDPTLCFKKNELGKKKALDRKAGSSIK